MFEYDVKVDRILGFYFPVREEAALTYRLEYKALVLGGEAKFGFPGLIRIEIGPDIQMGYAKGTQGSGKGALGDIEREMFRDNTDDWSGNHIMDLEAVPGVLFTSRPLGKPASSLQNLAASILAEFGVEGEFPRTDR